MSPSIRIARILGRPNVGGPARTVLHLARRLAPRGFETLVITGACDVGEADLLAGEDLSGVCVERVPEMRRGISLRDLAARRRIGLESGPIVYRDARTGRGAPGALRSRRHGLVGKPDYLLEVEGEPLVDLPLTERRARLEELLDRRNTTIRYSEAFEDGEALEEAVAAQGL